jgi:hypothetical protein
VVVPGMKNVVSAMTENQGRRDVKEETYGGNGKDELGIFDGCVGFRKSILLINDATRRTGRLTCHVDEFSDTL